VFGEWQFRHHIRVSQSDDDSTRAFYYVSELAERTIDPTWLKAGLVVGPRVHDAVGSRIV
jgi:hypothetical protein